LKFGGDIRGINHVLLRTGCLAGAPQGTTTVEFWDPDSLDKLIQNMNRMTLEPGRWDSSQFWAVHAKFRYMDTSCINSDSREKHEDELEILRMSQRITEVGPRLFIERGDTVRLFPNADEHTQPWQSVKKGSGQVPLEDDLCRILNPGRDQDGQPNWINAFADLKDFGRRK